MNRAQTGFLEELEWIQLMDPEKGITPELDFSAPLEWTLSDKINSTQHKEKTTPN